MSSARTAFVNILIIIGVSGVCRAEDEPPRPVGHPHYGWTVDSVSVVGNTKTKDIVILREMETQPGSVLQEKFLQRDIRFLRGLGLFADVEIEADSLSPGRCALRVSVKERSSYFYQVIYPVVNYDFDKGFSFGGRWDNKNFRGMNESLNASYLRDTNDDNIFSCGWFAPWLGWEHIELGANAWYYDRHETPILFNVIEQIGAGVRVGIPLTKKRISFAQALAALSFENRESGDASGFHIEQKFLNPTIGIRLDSRDSRIQPTTGHYCYMGVASWRAVDGPSQTYYRLWNDLRLFHPGGERLVLAMRSYLNYQFGEYPAYLTTGLGGSGTVRGYPNSQFRGDHLWIQTVEWRFTLVPKEVFHLPRIGYVDVGFAMLIFIDSGITWTNQQSFTIENFHSGWGFGVRLYSPFQDVVRLDIGFNSQGDVLPSVRTGVRF
jgi:outer membrane protein insertion porin family